MPEKFTLRYRNKALEGEPLKSFHDGRELTAAEVVKLKRENPGVHFEVMPAGKSKDVKDSYQEGVGGLYTGATKAASLGLSTKLRALGDWLEHAPADAVYSAVSGDKTPTTSLEDHQAQREVEEEAIKNANPVLYPVGELAGSAATTGRAAASILKAGATPYATALDKAKLAAKAASVPVAIESTVRQIEDKGTVDPLAVAWQAGLAAALGGGGSLAYTKLITPWAAKRAGIRVVGQEAAKNMSDDELRKVGAAALEEGIIPGSSAESAKKAGEKSGNIASEASDTAEEASMMAAHPESAYMGTSSGYQTIREEASKKAAEQSALAEYLKSRGKMTSVSDVAKGAAGTAATAAAINYARKAGVPAEVTSGLMGAVGVPAAFTAKKGYDVVADALSRPELLRTIEESSPYALEAILSKYFDEKKGSK